jgi:hypothetical protein
MGTGFLVIDGSLAFCTVHEGLRWLARWLFSAHTGNASTQNDPCVLVATVIRTIHEMAPKQPEERASMLENNRRCFRRIPAW